jgi:transposase
MNASCSYTVGIDLAQQSFQAARADGPEDVARWPHLASVAVPVAPDSREGLRHLRRWIAQQRGYCERIVVESTGKLSHRFAAGLRGNGLPEVVILNPRRSKAFGLSLGVRDKTDAIDAAVLALYGAMHRPRPTPPRTPTEQAVKELDRLRESYVTDRTAWKNRLQQTDDPEARAEIQRTIKHLDQQIERLEEAIGKKLADDPTLHRQARALQRIKGIGPVTSRTLTAELGDLRHYRRNELVAHAGLFPKRFESGSSVHRPPRLAKGGGHRLRRVLYMGATSLTRSKGPMRLYIESLRAQGMSDPCILGVLMRKLLLIARAVMLQDGHYDPAKIQFKTHRKKP